MIERERRSGVLEFWCGFPGCTFCTVDKDEATTHEAKPHQRCGCGKWQVSVPRHHAQARRFGISHLPNDHKGPWAKTPRGAKGTDTRLARRLAVGVGA